MAARPDDYARSIKTALDAATVYCGIGEAPVDRGWPPSSTATGTFRPYVKLWFGAGLAGPVSLGDRHGWQDYLFQVSAIGETAEQALQYAGRAREVLLPLVPAIDGRVVHWISQESDQPVYRDDETTPSLWLATAQYRLCSTPT